MPHKPPTEKVTRLEVEYDCNQGWGWCPWAGFYCVDFMRQAKTSLRRSKLMFPAYKFRLVSIAPDGVKTVLA